MSLRRSTREPTHPQRFGYSLPPSPSKDTPLPSTESTSIEEEPDNNKLPGLPLVEGDEEDNYYDASPEANPISPEAAQVARTTPAYTSELGPPALAMAEFTPQQTAAILTAISEAVAAALATGTPGRSSRALTADLQPPVGHFLPVLDSRIKAVDANKVKYPRLVFTDHQGEIDYDAWKMDMKLFIEEYSGNFRTGKSIVHAYFKCTGGEAKTIILQHMDAEFSGVFETAGDVLAALDQRFFDHNRVQTAKLKYQKLTMDNSTYNDFRVKFTNLATTGKIARSRWFEDICEKVSPALKHDLRIEKYKMNGDFATLDEFLAVADRESRNITAEQSYVVRKSVTVVGDRGRTSGAGILKPAKESWPNTENWRASLTSGSPSSPTIRFRTPSPGATTHDAHSGARIGACRHCNKSGHWVRDCPELAAHREMDKKIAEMVLQESTEPDEMTKNS